MEGVLGWLRNHRSLLVLSGLTVITYYAAINRHQSLPWGIAALLTAALLTGLAWPHWLILRLSVGRNGPTRAEEGETIVFRVAVSNHGWLPRFMVELVDRLPFVGAARGETSPGDIALGVVAYVPGRTTRHFEMPIVCEKRGHYLLGPVALRSSFPLGLVEALHKRNEGVQTLTVYPDVFPIVSLPLRGAASQIHRGGYLLPEGSGAAEFSGLREYRRGDNPRHIHWPTTARTNELMVKEFEPLASACLHLVLDLDIAANLGAGRHATLEYALRIAGSIARYGTQHGLRVRMTGEGARSVAIPAGSGELHYQRILDELAVVDADGALPYAYLLGRLAPDCQVGETIVAFLSAPPRNDQQLLQAMAHLRMRRANLHVILFDRGTFAPATGSMPESAAMFGALHELGAHCTTVRNGDDLARLFNP